MTQENTSLADQWGHSPGAQGFALGLVLGPVGMFLAYTFSARDKRQERLFGAIKGSLVTSAIIVAVWLILLATGAL